MGIGVYGGGEAVFENNRFSVCVMPCDDASDFALATCTPVLVRRDTFAMTPHVRRHSTVRAEDESGRVSKREQRGIGLRGSPAVPRGRTNGCRHSLPAVIPAPRPPASNSSANRFDLLVDECAELGGGTADRLELQRMKTVAYLDVLIDACVLVLSRETMAAAWQRRHHADQLMASSVIDGRPASAMVGTSGRKGCGFFRVGDALELRLEMRQSEGVWWRTSWRPRP